MRNGSPGSPGTASRSTCASAPPVMARFNAKRPARHPSKVASSPTGSVPTPPESFEAAPRASAVCSSRVMARSDRSSIRTPTRAKAASRRSALKSTFPFQSS